MSDWTPPTDADGRTRPITVVKPPLTGDEERTALRAVRAAKGLPNGSGQFFWDNNGNFVVYVGDMERVA